MCSALDSAVKIRFEGRIDGDKLTDIQELVYLIESNPNIETKSIEQELPEGAKSVLTSTLAIIGAATGVGAMIISGV